MNDPFDLTVRGQLFQIHLSQKQTPRAVILAIHGLSGDQHSMEIFTRKFHRDYCIVYPRAFHELAKGYSWVNSQVVPSKDASEWLHAVDILNFNFDLLMIDLGFQVLPHHLIGFSQGAALGLIYSVKYLSPDAKTALLAGFIPQGYDLISKSLNRRKFFIYHGLNDTTILPDEATHLVNTLRDAGATVEVCESSAGHKLSLACLESMEKFILGDRVLEN